MGQQLTIPFPYQQDYSSASLLPTIGTAHARQALAENLTQTICQHGGAGSGKTHLLHVWAAGQDAMLVGQHEINEFKQIPLPPYPKAVAVDDLESLPDAEQKQLFHLYNHFQQTGGHLAVASRAPVASLNLLPDLKSRLLTGLQIEVAPPTVEELSQLALKWAAEHQLVLPPDVISYLLNRSERSAPALRSLVLALNELSLEQRRAVTVPLARQLLQG